MSGASFSMLLFISSPDFNIIRVNIHVNIIHVNVCQRSWSW